jgi:hypothetical protein
MNDFCIFHIIPKRRSGNWDSTVETRFKKYLSTWVVKWKFYLLFSGFSLLSDFFFELPLIWNRIAAYARHSSKKNYSRLVKRLIYKFKSGSIILRKADKPKVFHLGRIKDYQKRSKEYIDKTQAYQCLGTNDPLPELIQRTNKYLLDFRSAKYYFWFKKSYC